MSDGERHSRFTSRTPTTVDITIVGYLDNSWAAQLGMILDHTTIADGLAVTVLRGELIDQAALFGVLNSLYGLGYPLLSVSTHSE